MILGFFRRRQKMVIIIMVILMVAFLVPTGLQSFSLGWGGKTYGTTRLGDVSTKVMQRAQISLAVLELTPMNDMAWMMRQGMQAQLPPEALPYVMPLLRAEDIATRMRAISSGTLKGFVM